MRLVQGAAAESPGDEDAAQVLEARQGDQAAFRALFDRHAPGVRRFLRDLGRDEAWADEGTQETFIRAHAGLGGLRDGQRLRPWLLGIARRVFLEELRRRRKHWPDGPGAAEELAPSPESALLDAEASRLFRAALARLPADRRAVLLLQIDHGLPYDEIAAVMGASPARVRNELHRGRAELRAFLAPYFREEP
ncbi:MAG TPA: RNA polymerase sigma factor [Kofleriaceae bacterium]|nr:RNA polymerase sigma factor [Kofleriaceae bacterium]